MSESQYARLRRAVLAYARALEAYGLFGQAWVEHSEELDRLWQDVLDAAKPEPSE
jgi:predicted phosphohydrolase